MARGDYNQRVPVEGHDELATLTQRFNEMATEVSHAHLMEREFVANVSHDLKTPLTSIQGFSQAMVDGAIQDEAGYRQAASIINSESRRMSRLVDELLDLSKLQIGLHSLQMRPTDLIALLSQLSITMQPQATAAGVDLTLTTQTQAVWVVADADKLQRAFANVIDNALKYTPQGGTVAVEVAQSARDTVGVEVRDTGRGIPPEDLPSVMDRFYQVDKSRSSQHGKSLGLGLAIAREIITAHRGELSIESQPGTGTCVRVSLPAHYADSPPRPGTSPLKRLATGTPPEPNGAAPYTTPTPTAKL
jgi:two-component system phosphate regulon sensor histidine kinase PhoR